MVKWEPPWSHAPQHLNIKQYQWQHPHQGYSFERSICIWCKGPTNHSGPRQCRDIEASRHRLVVRPSGLKAGRRCASLGAHVNCAVCLLGKYVNKCLRAVTFIWSHAVESVLCVACQLRFGPSGGCQLRVIWSITVELCCFCVWDNCNAVGASPKCRLCTWEQS